MSMWLVHKSYIACEIKVKFDISNHLPNFLLSYGPFLTKVFIVGWFPFNKFLRDAFILSEVCRKVCHFKIQVMLHTGNHMQNFG